MTAAHHSEPSACALVTGASSGLGAEYARQLAKKGYDLVLTARRMDRLEALAAELTRDSEISVHCISADLSSDEGIDQVEAYLKTIPNLEILVNNAGFGLKGSFEKNPIEETLGMIQVHVTASVRLTHTALPIMRKRNRGWIINVASMSAFLPFKNVSYSATKAFLVNFTRALETDLAGSGVHAQALCAGFIYTEFHNSPELTKIRHTLPSWLWLNADAVVRDSLSLLKRNRVVVVPGFIYKIIYFFARLPLVSELVHGIGMMILSRRK